MWGGFLGLLVLFSFSNSRAQDFIGEPLLQIETTKKVDFAKSLPGGFVALSGIFDHEQFVIETESNSGQVISNDNPSGYTQFLSIVDSNGEILWVLTWNTSDSYYGIKFEDIRQHPGGGWVFLAQIRDAKDFQIGQSHKVTIKAGSSKTYVIARVSMDGEISWLRGFEDSDYSTPKMAVAQSGTILFAKTVYPKLEWFDGQSWTPLKDPFSGTAIVSISPGGTVRNSHFMEHDFQLDDIQGDALNGFFIAVRAGTDAQIGDENPYKIKRNLHKRMGVIAHLIEKPDGKWKTNWVIEYAFANLNSVLLAPKPNGGVFFGMSHRGALFFHPNRPDGDPGKKLEFFSGVTDFVLSSISPKGNFEWTRAHPMTDTITDLIVSQDGERLMGSFSHWSKPTFYNYKGAPFSLDPAKTSSYHQAITAFNGRGDLIWVTGVSGKHSGRVEIGFDENRNYLFTPIIKDEILLDLEKSEPTEFQVDAGVLVWKVHEEE